MDQADTMRDAAVHVSALKAEAFTPLGYLPISADSHVTEPPNCYIDHIDPKFRAIAPHVVTGPNGGDVYAIDGMPVAAPIGGAAAAGIDPREIKVDEARYADMHRGGYDGHARVADQEQDGVGGEIIYPSVGMVLCNHPDPDYKVACFEAYNRWLQEFQSAAPRRIFGLGQTAVRSVDETVSDLRRIKEMGFCGVMMPGAPSTPFDYDDPKFDAVWEAAIALELPLSFHILTFGRDTGAPGDLATRRATTRPNQFQNVIRANQDILSLFIWSGVFERFPDLKVVCVEADAGWAPHYMYRMDHFYNRHRFWSKTREMAKLPSEFFRENIYLTFQDDFVAFSTVDLMNPRRLLWANDFPHSDSTWPWSQQMIARQTRNLGDEVRRWILRDNVVELYKLPVAN